MRIRLSNTGLIYFFMSVVGVSIFALAIGSFFPQPTKVKVVGQTVGQTRTVCSSGCTHTNIASAVSAAAAGETVMVSPGTYSGGITIGKAITLASKFQSTGDRNFINTTTINGGTPIITLTSGATGVKIIGFTFTGGTKGVVTFANNTEISDNRFMNVGSDAISWEETGGTIRRNHFEGAGDDCIDLDGPKTGIVEDNTCYSASDDGLESRLFDYVGNMQTITIRNNVFSGAKEDGIQLIDYPATSSYTYHIERNVLSNNVDAGLGIMDGGNTSEDFRGASIPERVHVINNTISGNSHGITGGDNLVAVNNILLNNRVLGMKNVDGDSSASYNLFWGNGTNYTSSNVVFATTKLANPLLDAALKPQAGSPAINAGTAQFIFKNQSIFSLQPGQYVGAAPDIGKFEAGFAIVPTMVATTPIPTQPVQLTPAPNSSSTSLNIVVFLHGIGRGGDNRNPQGLGNMDPKRKERTVTIDAFNASNVSERTRQGTVAYDTTTGSFKGTIDMGNMLSGYYTFRIKTSQFLRKKFPGNLLISSGRSISLPSISLIGGDINNDNLNNVSDYNVLLGCYSDLQPAEDCDVTRQSQADITDDGKVNQFDYSLFIRELSVVAGE